MILFYFLSAFIILIISVIIFRILKERREKIKIQSNSHVKKEAEISSNNVVCEVQDKSVKNCNHPTIYSIYQEDSLKSQTKASELNSKSINKKVMTKYQRYLGLGYNKRDRDIDQGDSIWR